MKLRNPWGSKEWSGRWSDEDAGRNPAVAHTLQTECDHTPAADDGVFCIRYEDLLRNFTRLEVCKVREGWHEHRKLLPMPRPTTAGQQFHALCLKGTADRSWMEFLLFQPGGREGGELHDRSLDLGGSHADLSLTLIHTPDPTPAGVRGWELTAIGRRENAAVVSLEEPGVRGGGGRSHLLLPLGGFCRANDRAICDGLATALVLYSSSPVEATTVSLSAAEVARCLLLRAKGGGGRTESTECNGGSIWLHRLKDNIGLVVVENQHATKTARVKYDAGGQNVTCSRGAAKTVDTIAPGHFQVCDTTCNMIPPLWLERQPSSDRLFIVVSHYVIALIFLTGCL